MIGMKRIGAGIFLLAASTLLFELSLTRIFSVLFYHHFAFLIISTALFGFGMSGLYLFLRREKQDRDLNAELAGWSIAFALLIPLVLKVILLLPYGFQEVYQQPFAIARLIATYAILALPFFCAGCVISLILRAFPQASGKLYGLDLAGASLGCLAVLLLVPQIGGAGSVVAAAALAACAAIAFWPRSTVLRGASTLALVALVVLLPYSERAFALPLSRIFEEKHGSFYQAPSRKIEFSAWSPISRIDVLSTAPSKLIYLDAGSNVSFLVPFDGNLAALKSRPTYRTIPYQIAWRKDVCIIGPGGGEDVLNALSYKPQTVTAVEMDPLVLKLLQGPYREFSGNIIEAPSTKWVNDEGRSFLRASRRQFDLIQTVHNCAPVALASGALNLTESYLFTVEAFREYWGRLKENGMLAIHRSAILRAASIVSVLLQQEGIADPENFVMVTTRKGSGGDTGFFLKKGRITKEEIARLQEAARAAGTRVVYAPIAAFQDKDNPYYRLLHPASRETFLQTADLDLRPSTDNWPFFDHYQRFGNFQQSTTLLPAELNKSLRFYNLGDLALLTLLAEAVLLAGLFIGVPLFRMRKQEVFSRKAVLLYFSALGSGFIVVEISLFQKHILFLGQPVYSISAVLFSLLLSAGAGSYFFQRRFQEGQERRWILGAGSALVLLLIWETFAAPYILDLLLGQDKVTRFVISGILIAPLGLVLGIPFPLGIRILGDRSQQMIAWAWGLNAYMTVVGSIVTIVLALLFGFRANFLIALALYVAGFLAIYKNLAR